MAQITSGIGLISGLNTGQIISELISLDAAPVTLLQTRIGAIENQQTAYTALTNQLQAIQTAANQLVLPQTFQSADATSSDPNSLSATTSVGAAVGTYSFQVSRLVSSQQSISNGFSDPSSDPVGAGTITLEAGGGEASSQTLLSQLNGGAGVQSGQFRITDRSGASAVINTTGDITLDDVINQINTAQGISVHASLGKSGIILTDTSGKTASNFEVQDLNGTAAQSLGLAWGVAGNTITGSDINFISNSTSLAQINDGNGITTAAAGKSDFTVTTSDGTQINVSLNGAKTIGDVINDINTAGGTNLTASIASNGLGIQLTDNSGGGGTLSIAAQNGSKAAAQLGLTGAATGNTITGQPLIANLDSVLVSSLNGGAGLNLGSISVTDRGNNTGTINLTGLTSVNDIINAINSNTVGVKITASLNSAGTGLQIQDTSGGSGNLVIGDSGGGTTAEQLGINGTFTPTQQTIDGANLQRQYVSANTTLSSYDGGTGVPLGQFKITNSTGVSATVDLTSGTYNTIGDVIAAINGTNIGVTASINSKGNGILLTDSTAGAGHLTVTDLGGTTASSLNIAGTATANTIDGAEEKTISVTGTDTLNSLVTKINQAGFGVTASIVNDGSASSPYRLSLTSINSGADGRVLIDPGTTGLSFTNLVSAQDAAVFYGGGGTSQPLLITSSSNQLTNVIKGVTVNLTAATNTPVTLSITPSPSGVESQLTSFVTAFNSLNSTIDTDTQFDTTTDQGGLLLGDATTQTISQTVYNLLNTTVTGGPYKSLADIGITISTDGSTNSPTLNFDTSTFEAAFAANPTAVSNLFTQATSGLGTAMQNAMSQLIDPVNGVVTLENETLATQITGYQNQITELNALLAEKQTQLQNEFNNMEQTLASLQSQQSILDSFAGIKPASSTSSGSSSTSSSSTGSGSSSTSG